jgi:N-acylneuraminate cytidylyltransferase
MYRLDERSKLHSLLPAGLMAQRRQDLPSVYILNGAIYIARIDWLRETKSFVTNQTVAYIMNQRNSIDIDTLEDFEIFQSRIEAANS